MQNIAIFKYSDQYIEANVNNRQLNEKKNGAASGFGLGLCSIYSTHYWIPATKLALGFRFQLSNNYTFKNLYWRLECV